MQSLWIDKALTYDGTQLSSLFAYKRFQLLGDSIIAFQGPCRVQLSEMVDVEDVLDNAPISSDMMLHFIVEHFINDMSLMVTRQRLLVLIVKEVLETVSKEKIVRQGDDLFFDGKLSVSIATLSPVSGLIHLALNITNEGTPVKTASLEDLAISDVSDLARKILDAYVAEVQSIDRARCKVRGVF
ncbi:DUF366 family protein [Metallumcola ferriviriculae]|uniref:DUF366 family protein n=1 Tax=Metallumcola ferriviriculae TaxID=3039180 RepID=A0AAU0UNE8_9FIRM|nr:DUF366 family protein [Desulfitibacteraceae bacterium MK1]